MTLYNSAAKVKIAAKQRVRMSTSSNNVVNIDFFLHSFLSLLQLSPFCAFCYTWYTAVLKLF